MIGGIRVRLRYVVFVFLVCLGADNASAQREMPEGPHVYHLWSGFERDMAYAEKVAHVRVLRGGMPVLEAEVITPMKNVAAGARLTFYSPLMYAECAMNAEMYQTGSEWVVLLKKRPKNAYSKADDPEYQAVMGRGGALSVQDGMVRLPDEDKLSGRRYIPLQRMLEKYAEQGVWRLRVSEQDFKQAWPKNQRLWSAYLDG